MWYKEFMQRGANRKTTASNEKRQRKNEADHPQERNDESQ